MTTALPAQRLLYGSVGRRFEAAVFDWDGTVVADRRADASGVRAVFERLLALGFDLCAVTGTHVGNVAPQLAIAPPGPGMLLYCVNRGSEVFRAGPEGPELVWRRTATEDEEQALDRAADGVVARLAALGLETAVVRDRLNRRKIDLIPLPEWADPPKSEIDALVDAVDARLRRAGVASLPAVVELARAAAAEAGLPTARVTSDAKHVEIGLTDKADSARWVFAHLERRGIAPEQTLVLGDELGPLGGVAGSDSLLLVDEARGATVVSVGVEPLGVPDGVVHLGGGPPRFAELLEDQLARREAGELPRPPVDPEWTVVPDDSAPENEAVRETLLTIGDGRIGTRGTFPSARAQRATVLAAGIYRGERAGERLLECPAWNGLDTGPLSSCRPSLDLRTATLSYDLARGDAEAEAILFSSLARPGTAVLRAAGDPRLVRSRAPLRKAAGTRARRLGDTQLLETQAGGATVVAAAREHASSGRVDRVAAYAEVHDEALGALRKASEAGVERLYAEHRQAWGARWADADVRIVGDPELTRAVRFSLFGLMSAVADSGEAAVGARGLSGPGYRGHVFWDSDVYVLPFLAATHPAAARAMIAYRLNRLETARAAARASGREGARFAWESTRSGLDVTPNAMRTGDGRVVPIRTGTHEEHVTADIAWALDHYLRWTDDAGLADDAAVLFAETARYWASRIRLDRAGRAHIYGVIGPDEYHEPVDDSTFTNVMVRWNLRRAASACGGGRCETTPAERLRWLRLADALVDGFDAETGIYEEFAGWYGLEDVSHAFAGAPFGADRVLGFDVVRRSQIVKQADVVLLHHLVPDEVRDETLAANLDYYEPLTTHGSSLSPAVHASLFARLGRFDEAVRYLRTAAGFDLTDVNGTTADGLHVATMGGVWQALAFGFAGCRPTDAGLVVDPRIPPQWEALELRLRFRGVPLFLRLTPTAIEAQAEGEATLVVGGSTHAVGRERVRL